MKKIFLEEEASIIFNLPLSQSQPRIEEYGVVQQIELSLLGVFIT